MAAWMSDQNGKSTAAVDCSDSERPMIGIKRN